MPKKKAKPKPKPKRTTPRRTPRTATLPGMEDHAIPELEAIAQQYADIRDQRIELTLQERGLKSDAIAAMHKHGRTAYEHDGVTIRLVPGEEEIKVKVRIAKEDEDDAEPVPLEEILAERRAAAEIA